jgi:phage FluMu protein Com
MTCAGETVEGVPCFILQVKCPTCKTWKILTGTEATKAFRQYLKKKEELNRVERLNEVGDYEPGVGGTAIEKYYCPKCHIFFRFVADLSHEIIE